MQREIFKLSSRTVEAQKACGARLTQKSSAEISAEDFDYLYRTSVPLDETIAIAKNVYG